MKIEPNTHLKIDAALCGEVVALQPGRAEVELLTDESMGADARGLVHGGFIFGLADYAAMLAVNDPNVVLGAAQSRFVAPVQVGQRVLARAEVQESAGKKRIVEAVANVDGKEVFRGTFTAFVLDQHVLDA